MKILISVLIAGALSLSAIAQSAPAPKPKLTPADIEKLAKELNEVDRASYKAAQEKGLDGWMSFFDPTAVSIQEKSIIGIEAIRAVYKKMYDQPSFVSMQWQPKESVVLPSGDLGYTAGETLLAFHDRQGNTRVSRGHYITTWKKEADGSWKIVCDAATGDPE